MIGRTYTQEEVDTIKMVIQQDIAHHIYHEVMKDDSPFDKESEYDDELIEQLQMIVVNNFNIG